MVCGYVLIRAMELSQRETSSSGTRVALGLLALLALGGVGYLGLLTSTALTAGTRPASTGTAQE